MRDASTASALDARASALCDEIRLTPESAIDREYDRELAQEELESATASAAADA